MSNTVLLSNWYGNLMWSKVIGKPGHTVWWLACHTGNGPSAVTNADQNEVGGGGYARQKTTLLLPGARNIVTSAPADFKQLPKTTVTWLALWDQISGGHMLAAIKLNPAIKIVGTGGLHVSAMDFAVQLGI